MVVDKILNPVRTLVENLSIFGAANPGSLAYTGGMSLIGAGFDVNVKFQGDAKKVLSGFVSQRVRDENDLQGRAKRVRGEIHRALLERDEDEEAA